MILKTGEPVKIIGYYGTSKKFNNFETKYVRNGFYFASEKRLHSAAGYYAGEDGYIIKAELTFNHPFVGTPNEISKERKDYKGFIKKYDGYICVVDNINLNANYYNYLTNQMEKEDLKKGDIVEMVVFEPEQIKIISKQKYNDMFQENKNVLEEKWELITNNTKFTKNVSDIKQLLSTFCPNMVSRILFDPNKGYWFVGDGLDTIHETLFLEAWKNGLYYFPTRYEANDYWDNGVYHDIFYRFMVRGYAGKFPSAVDIVDTGDDYSTHYVVSTSADTGYILSTRGEDLKGCGLGDILKKARIFSSYGAKEISNPDLEEKIKISENNKINLEENQDDWHWYYGSFEDYLIKYDITYIVANINNKPSIWYPLINPDEYKYALSEYMKYGELIHYPLSKIESWVDIIMKNCAIFQNLSAIYGGEDYTDEQYDELAQIVYNQLDDNLPYEEYKRYLIDNKTKFYMDWYGMVYVEDSLSCLWYILTQMDFWNKIKLPDGNVAFSDTQGWYDLMNFDELSTPEEALVQINKVLDVWHQRSDLASMFIRGGSDSLTRITNESIKNDYITQSKTHSLFENIQKITNDIFITNSFSDIFRICENIQPKQEYRLSYDMNKEYWVITKNTKDLIHYDIMAILWEQGFYPEYDTEKEFKKYVDKSDFGVNPYIIRFRVNSLDDIDIVKEKHDTDGYDVVVPFELNNSGFVLFTRSNEDFMKPPFRNYKD